MGAEGLGAMDETETKGLDVMKCEADLKNLFAALTSCGTARDGDAGCGIKLCTKCTNANVAFVACSITSRIDIKLIVGAP